MFQHISCVNIDLVTYDRHTTMLSEQNNAKHRPVNSFSTWAYFESSRQGCSFKSGPDLSDLQSLLIIFLLSYQSQVRHLNVGHLVESRSQEIPGDSELLRVIGLWPLSLFASLQKHKIVALKPVQSTNHSPTSLMPYQAQSVHSVTAHSSFPPVIETSLFPCTPLSPP